MKLTEFDNEWHALQDALQGATGKSYTEADLKAESAMPLQKLQKQWNLRILFTVLIAPLWLIAVFYFNYPLIQVLMGVVFVANIWSLYLSFSLKTRMAANANLPVLQYIKTNYDLISKAIRLEERVFIFIYPISVSAGFFAGASLSGNLSAILADSSKVGTLLLILLASMVVLTPLSHFLAKWLNKLAFGNYLMQLKKVIDSYESEKQ